MTMPPLPQAGSWTVMKSCSESLSIISPAVKGTVEGFGWHSYVAALRLAVELAQEKKK